MRKLFVWFCALFGLAALSFTAGKVWNEQRLSHKISAWTALDNGFRPAPYPIKQRSFVVLISAFNNGAFVEKSLRSVFSQAYDNVRLIYIDDASTDGSFELARDLIEQHGAQNVTMVRNESRLGTAANLIRAAKTCQDQEIIVMLNGDSFAHEWVLARLNQYYADPDLWMTFGQYREFPSYRLGDARSYRAEEKVRLSPFVASHLQTFYAAFAKQIPESDLMSQGALAPQSSPMAVIIPMLEMAQDHYQFIPDILAIVPTAADLADREEEAHYERLIRSLQPFEPLSSLKLSVLDESTGEEVP